MGLEMYMEKTKKENIEGLLSLWSITDIFKAANKYHYYLDIKEKIEIAKRKESNQLDETKGEFFTYYEEVRDSSILHKYKEAYNFVFGKEEDEGKKQEVAYWGKEYELNSLILDTIVPDGFVGDSNCVTFEVNKQHLEEILDKAQAYFDLTDEYEKAKVEDIQHLLNETNFDKEILFYYELY